ncbi:MAG: hypothetical protein HYU99_02195 [Deltaproteobacteria bacterium]|nr:hypothetical protein [Deltaproteobacteria bacterium]
MKNIQLNQYTIRSISPKLDRRLRQKAKESDKSLNEVVLEALSKATGLADETIIHHDLDFLIGSWQEDPAFDEAIKAQHQIDEELWR